MGVEGVEGLGGRLKEWTDGEGKRVGRAVEGTDDDGGVEALPGRVVAELPRPTLQRRAPSLGIPLCLLFFSCFSCFDILVGCERWCFAG